MLSDNDNKIIIRSFMLILCSGNTCAELSEHHLIRSVATAYDLNISQIVDKIFFKVDHFIIVVILESSVGGHHNDSWAGRGRSRPD